MEGRGPVLVPGEGEPLRGHQLLHHRHDPGGGRVVQDADRVLKKENLYFKVVQFYHLFLHTIKSGRAAKNLPTRSRAELSPRSFCSQVNM